MMYRMMVKQQGYLDDQQGPEDLWRGGYLYTGDLGHIDEFGYLKVADQVKDVIKSGGVWISFLLLEEIATNHPDVSKAEVIAVPDSKWGETIIVDRYLTSSRI